MFVSLSITLKTFKCLALLEARAATTKRGGGKVVVSIVSAPPLKEIFAPP